MCCSLAVSDLPAQSGWVQLKHIGGRRAGCSFGQRLGQRQHFAGGRGAVLQKPNSSVRPLTIPVLTVNIILVGRTNPATKAFSRPVQLGVGTVSGVEVP